VTGTVSMARCPCIGIKETERCGTTLLSYACYSLDVCDTHSFPDVRPIFVQRLVRFGLQGEPAAVGLCRQFSSRVEPCSASMGVRQHQDSRASI